MKKITITTLLILFVSIPASFSQKKYQGLLWEITGNGLKEPSYLYGTMHVSDKIAFNVSDSFYMCLAGVDQVALESSPAGWMDEYGQMSSMYGRDMFSGYNYGYAGFYENAFELIPISKGDFYELLGSNNNLMNQILYRFSPGAEDYQEDTYLDMFIFQAGSKYNKPIHSLEELKEVFELTIKAYEPDEEEEELENDYNQYLENDDYYRYYELIQDAYRTGDLDMLDSLNRKGSMSKNYHKYFIVERNKNMMRRLDSIMQYGSVFTGIGAAHLPGEEGAIELLRGMGYTVRAVDPNSSAKGHKLRKKMLEYYRPVEFTQATTTDQAISVFVPGKLYEMPTNSRGYLEYLSPEPINGGYFSMIRIFTYGPIFNKSPEYYKASFDSLIYITTPGEIKNVTPIELNGYKGYDISSKTSKSSIIRYKIFFTPTEIVLFKGTGTGEYIEHAEPQMFFSKLSLVPQHDNWTEVKPRAGGAHWKMKGPVTGQDFVDNLDSQVDPLYQSFDKTNQNYFLVMRYTLNDLSYIEEDSFDLAYLGKSFGTNIGYEVSTSDLVYQNNLTSMIQKLEPDEKHPELKSELYVKITAYGGNYFMMITTANNEDKETFFNSFGVESYSVKQTYAEIIDSSMFFKVNTVELENSFDASELTNMMYRNYYGNDDMQSEKAWMHDTKERTFTNHRTGEQVAVTYTKFSHYHKVDSMELFWKNQIEQAKSGQTLRITRLTYGTTGSDPTVDFLLSDTASSRGIITHMRLHHGVLYTLKTLTDTAAPVSEFVHTIYTTFSPLDTLVGRSLYEDKVALFFENVNGTDTTEREMAIKNISWIHFEPEHIDRLILLYRNFPYDKTNENEYKQAIMNTLGGIEDKKAYDFLETIYNENGLNSNIQFEVLNTLSWTETAEACLLIKKLLTQNTPFTDDRSKLNFFHNLGDSLELVKPMFPDLLTLISFPEYKERVFGLLSDAYLDSIVTKDQFAKDKQMIIREANVEIKRVLSDQEQDEPDENDYNYYNYNSYYLNHYGYSSEYNQRLLDFYVIMSAFKNDADPQVKLFYEGLAKIKDKQLKLEIQIVNHKLGLPIDTAVVGEVTRDIETTVWAYNRLHAEELEEYFTGFTQEKFAFHYLYKAGYKAEEDSVVFLHAELVTDGVDTGYVYFFKRKAKDKKYWMLDYVGLLPTDTTDFFITQAEYKKDLSFKTEDELEETLEIILERFALARRQRVSFAQNDYWGMYGGMFGEYER
ncbi:MAG: TraB/GumN family protein [Crocinitomicaceae bacterium]|nr:TraB/GumN family protein [Crocinitomicaceae bacterium]